MSKSFHTTRISIEGLGNKIIIVGLSKITTVCRIILYFACFSLMIKVIKSTADRPRHHGDGIRIDPGLKVPTELLLKIHDNLSNWDSVAIGRTNKKHQGIHLTHRQSQHFASEQRYFVEHKSHLIERLARRDTNAHILRRALLEAKHCNIKVQLSETVSGDVLLTALMFLLEYARFFGYATDH